MKSERPLPIVSLSLSLSLSLDELGAGRQSAKIEDEFFQPPSRVESLPPVVDSFSFYHTGCLYFRNSAFNVDYVLIYFGNEGVTQRERTRRDEGVRVVFLLERSMPFCILLAEDQLPIFLPSVYAIYHSLCLSHSLLSRLHPFPPSSISAPIFLSYPFAAAVSFFFFIYERILNCFYLHGPSCSPKH